MKRERERERERERDPYRPIKNSIFRAFRELA
jgi:hypothetical protein